MTLAIMFSTALSFNAFAMFSGGYILANAYGSSKTFLIDSTGDTAFAWDHSKLTEKQGGYSCYLLENGNLLRSAIVPENAVVSVMAPRQGIVEEIDPSGKVVWKFQLANDTFMLHHDMKPMPNGHVLAACFVVQTQAQMLATGVDTMLLRSVMGAANKFILSEKIIEIDPKAAGGPKIVWEWKMYEHITPGATAAEHPELFSGTITSTLFYTNQWVHLNGLDYNPKLDLILFSSRVFSELYIIDHNLTTQEASGHTGGARGKGGDILYRWGKPANYKASGATTINVLHGCNWIPESYPEGGNIIFFCNNGTSGMMKSEMGSLSQSQVIEIKPPMGADGKFQFTTGQAYGPAQPTWKYAPSDSFFSPSMSCAFRLPNGNSLALVSYPSSGAAMNISGNSLLVEVDNSKQVVAKIPLALKGEAVEARNPSKFNPAKIMFYEKNYKGIQCLLFGSRIQKGNIVSNGSLISRVRIHQRAGVVYFSNIEGCEISFFNLQGKKVFSARPARPNFRCETTRFPAGLYCAQVSRDKLTAALQMINTAK